MQRGGPQVLAHHSVISLGIVAQARESIPALLADASLADSLRPYVNMTATELAAIGRGLPISVPLDGAGQGGRYAAAPPASRGEAGVPMDSPESVPSPLRFDPGASGADGLDRFLADYRQPEPSPEPGMGATPLAGISTDRSASSADPDRETGSPGGWDPAALARLASLQVSLSWPDSPDTSSVAGETSGQAPGLKTRGSDYAPFAEIGARSRSLADLGPLVPRPDDGIAGLFDAVGGHLERAARYPARHWSIVRRLRGQCPRHGLLRDGDAARDCTTAPGLGRRIDDGRGRGDRRPDITSRPGRRAARAGRGATGAPGASPAGLGAASFPRPGGRLSRPTA